MFTSIQKWMWATDYICREPRSSEQALQKSKAATSSVELETALCDNLDPPSAAGGSFSPLISHLTYSFLWAHSPQSTAYR